MAKVSTYINFSNKTEEAFNFYKSIFGGEFTMLQRLGEAPAQPGMTLPEDAKNLIMHIALPILGGHMLLGTDAPESMGFKLVAGNNVHINLEPDTREEADRLFAGLSVGGRVDMPLADMFWGAYFGSFADKYGIQWMINCSAK